jgi:hypothetical protein
MALSVAVRWKPVMTVVNGTLVARQASTTMLRAWLAVTAPSWSGGEGQSSVTTISLARARRGSR